MRYYVGLEWPTQLLQGLIMPTSRDAQLYEGWISLQPGIDHTICTKASKPLYSQKQFVDTFLYGLPLDRVQELIKLHYPEVLI